MAAQCAAQERIDREAMLNAVKVRREQDNLLNALESRAVASQSIESSRQGMFDEKASYRAEYGLNLQEMQTRAHAKQSAFLSKQAQRVAKAAAQRSSAKMAVERHKASNAARSRDDDRAFVGECRTIAMAEKAWLERRAASAERLRSDRIEQVDAALHDAHTERARSASAQRDRIMHEGSAILEAKKATLASNASKMAAVHERLSPERVVQMRHTEVQRKRAIADEMKSLHHQTDLNVSRVRRAEAEYRQSLHDSVVQQRFEPKWPSAVRAHASPRRTRSVASGATREKSPASWAQSSLPVPPLPLPTRVVTSPPS